MNMNKGNDASRSLRVIQRTEYNLVFGRYSFNMKTNISKRLISIYITLLLSNYFLHSFICGVTSKAILSAKLVFFKEGRFWF